MALKPTNDFNLRGFNSITFHPLESGVRGVEWVKRGSIDDFHETKKVSWKILF